MRISRYLSVLGVVLVTCFAGVLTSAAAHATSSSVQAPVLASGIKDPGPTWKTWHCGKATKYQYNGGYMCKRWVRFDYCGSGRPMRLNQVTKMRGGMVAEFAIKPNQSSQIDYSHTWKKVSTAKRRNMFLGGSRGHYLYVNTYSKPAAKPYVTCDHP